MRAYPSQPGPRAATIRRDVAALLLVVLFAWLGVKVHDTVAELRALGQGVQQAGRSIDATARGAADAVRGGFGSAADAVGGAPVIGGDLSSALRSAGEGATAPLVDAGAAGGRELVDAGVAGERRVESTARLLGWLTFGVPTLLLLALVAPGRVRQARALTAAARVLDAAPLDRERARLLAERAAFSLPYAVLLRHTPDPMGDLLAGRHDGLLRALGEDAGVALSAPTAGGR